jgi:hypothetical protein
VSIPPGVEGLWGHSLALFTAIQITSGAIRPQFGNFYITGSFPSWNYNLDPNNVHIVNNSGQYAVAGATNAQFGTAGASLRCLIGNITPGVNVSFTNYDSLWYVYGSGVGPTRQGFKGLFGDAYYGPPVGIVGSTNSATTFYQVYYNTFIVEAGTATSLNTTVGATPGYGLDFVQPVFAPNNIQGSYHTQGINVATTRYYNTDWWG